MGAHIVTGYAGKEHVTSADAGALNAGIVGSGKYVLKTGNQFAAEIVSNNLIKVKSGDLVNQGRHMRIDANDYEEVTIQNGAQSVKRNDLIVMRYKKDTSTLIETAEIVVIKGTAGSTATDPTYTSGDVLAGATQDDFPLYRVSLNGLNIEKVTPLFSTVPNLNELNTNMVKLATNTMRKGNNWSKSGGGLYYNNHPVDTILPSDAIIISALIIEWSGLSAPIDICFSETTREVQFTSESYIPLVNSNSYVKYRIAYI